MTPHQETPQAQHIPHEAGARRPAQARIYRLNREAAMNLPPSLRVRGKSNMNPGDSITMRAIQNPGIARFTCYLLHLRVHNALNQRGHWTKWAKANAEAKSRAFNALLRQQVPMLPVTVTMVREGPRKLDDDGLAASLKHVRDGIAEAFGVDDGDDRWTWAPEQEKALTYGVRITIQGREA